MCESTNLLGGHDGIRFWKKCLLVHLNHGYEKLNKLTTHVKNKVVDTNVSILLIKMDLVNARQLGLKPMVAIPT